MDSSQSEDDIPVVDAAGGARYTLEILSEITGVSRQTILLYREHGIIRPVDSDEAIFDEEALHALRRIEHLRDACEMNLSGLRILASLLDEVERLRADLRASR